MKGLGQGVGELILGGHESDPKLLGCYLFVIDLDMFHFSVRIRMGNSPQYC